MDIEARVRRLEGHYRRVLSAAVAAKARYLAVQGEPSATPTSIARAKSAWQTLDMRRRDITRRMAELEEMDQIALF